MGHRDRASMIFALMSGTYVMNINYEEQRYQIIKNYSTQFIYHMLFNNLKVVNHDIGSYCYYPPYIYLASVQESPVENLLLSVNEQNVDHIFNKLKLAKNMDTMSYKDKLKYLEEDLPYYSE